MVFCIAFATGTLYRLSPSRAALPPSKDTVNNGNISTTPVLTTGGAFYVGLTKTGIEEDEVAVLRASVGVNEAAKEGMNVGRSDGNNVGCLER